MKKKIICWLEDDLTCYFIAHHIQKKLDCELYAIIDITDKPKKFFEKQNLVKFKQIWFFHDFIKNTKKNPDTTYLKSIEEKYGIDLWKLAINERIFYRFFDFHKFSSDEILNICEQSCRLFEDVIKKVNPDNVISMDTKFHHSEIFYEMCLKLDIKFYMPSYPNIGFRGIISQKFNVPDNINELSKTNPQNRSFIELQQYIKKMSIRDQRQEFDDIHGGSKKEKIKAGIDFFIKSNNSNEKSHYSYYGRTKTKVLLHTIHTEIETRKRKKFIDMNLKKDIPKNQPYVYYPLGVDMEKSTLIQSPLFTNQIEIICQIAKSIPIEYKLFVKEHQGQIARGWRSKEEYEEISGIPNVELLHPDIKGEEILQNCDLVVTVGGTTGFEAAVYGKPSIVFSDVYYSVLPSVTRVEKIHELPKIIRNALKIKVNNNDVDRYLTFYQNNSFSYNYDGFTMKVLNYFYRAGNLVDVEITEEQIKDFMKKNDKDIQILVSEFVKKLQ